jgi:hypothetical protein
MKIKGTKQLKPNAKTTKIRCIRCSTYFISRRNHTKTCSKLCRVQEKLEREDNGYIHHMLSDGFNALLAFLSKITDFAGMHYFYDLSEEIKEVIANKDNSYSWKVESGKYRLAFFPKNKKKPFELYFNDNLKRRYDSLYGEKKRPTIVISKH